MTIGTFLPRPAAVALGLALPIALAACATDGSTPAGAMPAPPATEDDCGAASLSGYVGRKATDDVIAALRAWRGEHPIRVLTPGSVVTMDFRPDRLNVDVDENGVITGFRCT